MKRAIPSELCSDRFDAGNKVRITETSLLPHTMMHKPLSQNLPEDLRQLAMQIEKADTMIHSNTCNKLVVIAQQMKFLTQQAQDVIKQHQRDVKLHHASCNFIKVPGNIYHLYSRPSGEYYFSMLSPQEWTIDHEYSGSYRLEQDRSWTDVREIPNRDSQYQSILGMFPQYPQLMN